MSKRSSRLKRRAVLTRRHGEWTGHGWKLNKMGDPADPFDMLKKLERELIRTKEEA